MNENPNGTVKPRRVVFDVQQPTGNGQGRGPWKKHRRGKNRNNNNQNKGTSQYVNGVIDGQQLRSGILKAAQALSNIANRLKSLNDVMPEMPESYRTDITRLLADAENESSKLMVMFAASYNDY